MFTNMFLLHAVHVGEYATFILGLQTEYSGDELMDNLRTVMNGALPLVAP